MYSDVWLPSVQLTDASIHFHSCCTKGCLSMNSPPTKCTYKTETKVKGLTLAQQTCGNLES